MKDQKKKAILKATTTRNDKDMYDPQNPYWLDHYYTPDDAWNNEYIRLINSFTDNFAKIPPIFLNGIAQLDKKMNLKNL